MKKPTIKDVAKASGCSTATVSLALAEGKSRISEQTRQKVRKAAQELGYHPNRIAVNLATNKSNLVSIVVSDLTNPHMAAFYMALESVLYTRGYASICYTGLSSSKYSLDMLQKVVENSVAGLVLGWPYSGDPGDDNTHAMRQYLDSTGLPIVTRNMPELNLRGVEVSFDFAKGGELATKHLLELGHTRIGCVTGPMNMPVTQQRLQGYQSALDSAGVPYRPELVYHSDYTMSGTREALSYLLGQKASAIFAFNDEMAFELYRSARQYGVSIPKDISIIGFDNVSFGDVLEVPLSTIHIPTEDIGKCVAEEMVNMIEQGRPESLKTILYEPSLMIRASTASPSV